MDAPLSKQQRFIDWLTQHSASFQKLEFREGKLFCLSHGMRSLSVKCTKNKKNLIQESFSLAYNCYSCASFYSDSDGCGSVYSSTDIAEDEVFLTIPFSPLVLTDGLARKALPKSAEVLDGRTALTLFLMQQSLLKDNAFFHPYLDMVPDKIHTALEFDDQDLEHLRGTNAYLTVKELQQNLRQKFNDTMRIVGSDLKERDGYTWEKFLWAETVLSSRAFPAHLFGGGIEGEIVLIPLAGKGARTEEDYSAEFDARAYNVEMVEN